MLYTTASWLASPFEAPAVCREHPAVRWRRATPGEPQNPADQGIGVFAGLDLAVDHQKRETMRERPEKERRTGNGIAAETLLQTGFQ